MPFNSQNSCSVAIRQELYIGTENLGNMRRMYDDFESNFLFLLIKKKNLEHNLHQTSTIFT